MRAKYKYCAGTSHLWTLGTWVGPLSIFFGDLAIPYVLSGIICGAFCGGFLVERPGMVKMVSSCIVLWLVFGCGSYGGIFVGCFVYTLSSGAGYFSTLKSFTRRGLCICGNDVFNICVRFHSASICLLPRCGIGMDGVRLGRVPVRYTTAWVTMSSGDSIGRFLLFGTSYFMSGTIFNSVLGTYYVRHM